MLTPGTVILVIQKNSSATKEDFVLFYLEDNQLMANPSVFHRSAAHDLKRRGYVKSTGAIASSDVVIKVLNDNVRVPVSVWLEVWQKQE